MAGGGNILTECKEFQIVKQDICGILSTLKKSRNDHEMFWVVFNTKRRETLVKIGKKMKI